MPTTMPFLLVLGAFVIMRVEGTLYNWIGGSYDVWNQPTNWEPTGIPGPEDYASVSSFGSSSCAPDCVLDLDDADVVVGGLNFTYAFGSIVGGALTTNYQAEFYRTEWEDVTLITKGETVVSVSMSITGSTWEMQGNTMMTNLLVNIGQDTIFTNKGILSMMSDGVDLVGDSDHYPNIIFYNQGTMVVNSATETTPAIVRMSFNNTGTLTITSGSMFNLWSNDDGSLPADRQAQVFWSGTININNEGTLMLSQGQHTFSSNVVTNLQANSNVRFVGRQSQSGGGADDNWQSVVFSKGMTIPNLEISHRVIVTINFPLTVTNIVYNGGIIKGDSSQLFTVQNWLESSCSAGIQCPVFHRDITVTNAPLWSNSAVYFDNGAKLTITGSWFASRMSMFEYITSDTPSNSVFVNRGQGTLQAFASSVTDRHTFQIPVNNEGVINAVQPASGACLDQGIISQFSNGGTHSGVWNYTNCGNDDADEDSDLMFSGPTTFNQGTLFTGPGSISFQGDVLSGSESTSPAARRTKQFNVHVMRFPMRTKVVGRPIIAGGTSGNSIDLHFSNFLYNGGMFSIAGRAFLDVTSSSSLDGHTFTNTLLTDTIIGGSTNFINNGRLYLDNARVQSAGSGTIVNNGVMLAGRNAFSNGANVINNANLTVSRTVAASLVNRGPLLQLDNADKDPNDPENAEGTAVGYSFSHTLSSNSTLLLRVWSAAQPYGSNLANYDQADYTEASACVLGGNLILQFIDVIPTVGSKYPFVAGPNSGSARCSGWFLRVLAAPGSLPNTLALGVEYNRVPEGNYAALVSNVIVCRSTDPVCGDQSGPDGTSSTTGSSSSAPSLVPLATWAMASIIILVMALF
eukprot:TRINITY_DN13841_c0_g1_i1.p1 TRINITY_DN13841_c0_g1~~TRINITY_DN13841_c0_g1_i1.p1  ORF type:complete len:863 (+),score=169.68 TRINITY_DN13841_c0_g1_i1:23-2590(+)